VLESVEGTGRLVVVDEAPAVQHRHGHLALVARKRSLAAGPHRDGDRGRTPVPFSNALEDIYIPDAQRVVTPRQDG